MNTLEYVLGKFGLKRDSPMPINIPGIGRRDLAKLFKELEFKVGVEVGVEEGRYSQTLCVENPDLHLFAIDPWLASDDYRCHIDQAAMDKLYDATVKRLLPYRCTILRQTSMNAVQHFEDGLLDFVYLDGNHEFRHLTDDLSEWTNKVHIGGIIAGHDYWRPKDLKQPYVHVVEVVNAWTKAWRISPWFVLDSDVGHELGDHNRSWFWVKMNEMKEADEIQRWVS